MKMKQYKCVSECSCAKPCRMTVCGDADAPTMCAFEPRDAYWIEVKSEPLPKLTAAVFDREDCPEWARFAGVDREGNAAWMSHRPIWYGLSCRFPDSNGEWQLWNIPGKWDASDWLNSLIERPAKPQLPAWCRVGSYVHNQAIGWYGRIARIDSAERIHVTIPPEPPETSRRFDIWKLERLRPAHLRHYNDDELRALVGRVFDWGEVRALCVGYRIGRVFLGNYNRGYSAHDLLNTHDLKLDGRPCGVFAIGEAGE